MLTWLRRGHSERRVGRAATARPFVEVLEDRLAPAIRFLPGFNTNVLAANDDGSTGAINVGFDLNFFGVTRNQVFVNNNGNVTFDQPFSDFTPNDLNSDNGGIPIIAAFFADVDTTGTGSGVVTYGRDVLCGRPVFGVNYVNVGYFSGKTDKLNSFQIILIERSDTGAGNFDIEFNYDRIRWETGDVDSPTDDGLGGDSARVGYSNGTGAPGTFFELAGSGVPGSFLDGGPQALTRTALLSATPGRIHLLVRNGQVILDNSIMINREITDSVRTLFPLRYLSDVNTQIQTGNLTVVNVGGRVSPFTSAIDACLDITADPSAAAAVTFDGPITFVFPTLTSNVGGQPVTVLNPTGFTASGQAFITVAAPNLPPLSPVVRAQVVLQNTSLDAITTFFIGYRVRIFSGPFDPSMA